MSADYSVGKYSSARDEVLHIMAGNGWANQSDGDVSAPSDWFARVSNAPADILEISQAFEDDAPAGFDWQTLIGHYLVIEDDRGFVGVQSFDSERRVIAAYSARVREFERWDAS